MRAREPQIGIFSIPSGRPPGPRGSPGRKTQRCRRRHSRRAARATSPRLGHSWALNEFCEICEISCLFLFSSFPFRPSNLGLFGASLQPLAPAPQNHLYFFGVHVTYFCQNSIVGNPRYCPKSVYQNFAEISRLGPDSSES